MSAAIVLNLDDVSARDLLALVCKGALKPGRITPRGAVVYELTTAGVAAVEAWAEDPEGELRELGQACRDGECEHAHDHASEEEEHSETRQELDQATDKLNALRGRAYRLCEALAGARISKEAREALKALREIDE